jgi:granule-bound starch synthase
MLFSAARSSLLVLLAAATAQAAVSPLGSPALRRAGGAGALLRSLRVESDDTGGPDHGDPDSVVPQSGDKTTDERALSCAQLKNLYLRGGGDAVASPEEKLQIVFVSAEIAPWSITGGLGAVCDGLPRAMAKLGHRVMSIAPRYDQYYDAWDTEFTAEVPMGDGMTTVRFFHAFKKGVDRVFVDHPLFLEKVWGQTKQKLYGPKWGKDYEDNQLRFAMFCKAAMVATEKLSLGGFPYGQDVTFVANDWHASLLPMYVKDEQTRGSWMNAKTATLLHNMVFQGRFPYDPKCAERLRLPQSVIDSFVVTQPLKVGKQKKQIKGLKGTEEIPNPAIECVNFVLGGILNSDQTLTVSPGYAREIVEDAGKGAEMSKHLKGVLGILNGVEDIVDPSNTELGLDVQYDGQSLEVKSELKVTMQKSLGFQSGAEIPLFVFMGRLDAQKGVDIMFEAIDAALQKGLNAQFVVMGSGIEELEEVAADLEDKYPSNFKAVLSFKGVEKYKTYAAADFALMPSRYEPCGLVQMEGMRFGTLPIVAPTGGLADTVLDMKTGLVMEAEVDDDTIVQKDVDMIVKNMERAMALFGNREQLRTMQKAAMSASKDFTWAASAKQYISTFKAMGSKPPSR